MGEEKTVAEIYKKVGLLVLPRKILSTSVK